MDRITVAEVIKSFESILQVLDSAYWEASQIGHKDALYDTINILHMEINELSKLSIEDHYMAYEPITSGFRNSQPKFKLLQHNLTEWVMRSQTADRLEEELPEIIALLNQRL